jgi:hypothetical protein
MCVYSQLTGNLRCVDDITGQEYLNCSAYSGKGIGLNNPELQYLSGDLPSGLTIPGFTRPTDAGSIPRGDYIIGYPIRRPHKAAPVLPLFPTPDNSALGRTELQIHGDNNSLNHSASDGCIIAKRSVEQRFTQVNTFRLRGDGRASQIPRLASTVRHCPDWVVRPARNRANRRTSRYRFETSSCRI